LSFLNNILNFHGVHYFVVFVLFSPPPVLAKFKIILDNWTKYGKHAGKKNAIRKSICWTREIVAILFARALGRTVSMKAETLGQLSNESASTALFLLDLRFVNRHWRLRQYFLLLLLLGVRLVVKCAGRCLF